MNKSLNIGWKIHKGGNPLPRYHLGGGGFFGTLGG